MCNDDSREFLASLESLQEDLPTGHGRRSLVDLAADVESAGATPDAFSELSNLLEHAPLTFPREVVWAVFGRFLSKRRNEKDLRAAADSYWRAKSLLSASDQPDLWSSVQFGLGDVYANLFRLSRQRTQEENLYLLSNAQNAFALALASSDPDSDLEVYREIENLEKWARDGLEKLSKA